MVAFLEKHFEFTTSLSMDECVARLKAKSKRGSGWLASKRDILVRISDDGASKKVILDRDVGRGLYAVVQGYLVEDSNTTVRVRGFGRVPFFLFLFNSYFFIATCFFA